MVLAIEPDRLLALAAIASDLHSSGDAGDERGQPAQRSSHIVERHWHGSPPSTRLAAECAGADQYRSQLMGSARPEIDAVSDDDCPDNRFSASQRPLHFDLFCARVDRTNPGH